jgi:hypothetical protein
MNYSKNGSYNSLKNTRFGMWKVSPKTPHTQFLCCFQLYKLPLKQSMESKTGMTNFAVKFETYHSCYFCLFTAIYPWSDTDI